MFTGLKTNRPECYTFNFFFMMRRLFYALCLNRVLIVTDESDLIFNVLAQIIMSALLIYYVVSYMPYEIKSDNYLEIFNETCVLLLFLLPLCCIIVDDTALNGEQRQILGYVMIGILGFNIVGNYSVFFVKTSKLVYKKVS